MTPTTPLMKQFLQIKGEHPDAILFFRVGDFYEMFFDDAVTASRILQITLTSRNKNQKDPVPLCGIPYHAASSYIARLIRSGKSVAVCEQVEDVSVAKGIVKREVVRVITPGTIIEPELLSPKENNYLAALMWRLGPTLEGTKQIGLACIDLSTGSFQVLADDMNWRMLEGELIKISPKEILLSEKDKTKMDRIQSLATRWPIRFTLPSFFDEKNAENCLKSHFKIHSLSSFGGGPYSLAAAGALLAHLQETQKRTLGNITSLHPIPSRDLMRIHPLAIRHLDLVPFSRDQKRGTLFHLLDLSVTAMGGRLLKESILRPLLLSEAIQKRQDGVSFFYDNLTLRKLLRDLLKQISDIERLIGRISLKAAQPRDLIALKESITLLPMIEKEILQLKASTADIRPPEIISDLLTTWDNVETVCELINRAIVSDPPFSLKEGGVIKPGYLSALDELRHFQNEGRSMLTEIENKERKKTGIESLKIRYNQIHGYYIEVSKTHLSKIPEYYIRKQTLTHAERFMTPELKALEERLTGARAAISGLEEQAFEEIRYDLSQETGRIQKAAQKIALLDLLSTLAEVAHRKNYCRPRITDGLVISITEGRHPVLEEGMSDSKTGFIPNDTHINPPSEQFLILTGPNMAGKSTYMRQIALIVLLAQMGGYVPAREAIIGVCDQIFTRVGAQDALNEGMSTFMVEMTEMSQILHHATEKSLILLDEIGRGTGTFDGISIAWAIAEFVYNTLKSRTLFATHYHELTGLTRVHSGIRNYHVLVREWEDEIVFLRKMVKGGSDKSYGIQVGRLAGLPTEIIKKAKKVLKALDEKAYGSPLYAHFVPKTEAGVGEQADLFSAASARTELPNPKIQDHPVLVSLRKIDPLNLTPIQALQVLADLTDQLKEPAQTPERLISGELTSFPKID